MLRTTSTRSVAANTVVLAMVAIIGVASEAKAAEHHQGGHGNASSESVRRIVPSDASEISPPAGLVVPDSSHVSHQEQAAEKSPPSSKKPPKNSQHFTSPEPIMLRCRMLSSLRVDVTDPGAVLTLKKELELTQEQVLALQEIEAQARKAAVQVLKKEQMMKLQPLAQTPNNVLDLHHHMMQRMQADGHEAMHNESAKDTQQMQCPLMEMMKQMHGAPPRDSARETANSHSHEAAPAKPGKRG